MRKTKEAPNLSSAAQHQWTKRPGDISHAVSPPPLLDGLQLNHGPIPEIGRFLLAADAALMRRGVRLSLGSISDLIAIQRRNEASWPILAPNLDSRYSDVSDLNSYCLIGRDMTGRVVATQAGTTRGSRAGTRHSRPAHRSAPPSRSTTLNAAEKLRTSFRGAPISAFTRVFDAL